MKVKSTLNSLKQRIEELKDDNEKLEDGLRRANRTIRGLSLDLGRLIRSDSIEECVFNPKPALKAILRAKDEFNKKIEEPSGSNWIEIDKYIRSDQGLDWLWLDEYTKNHSFHWCGAFVAYCYGFQVKNEVRKKIFASCYRMYENWYRSSRLIQKGNLKAGDIVTVFNSTNEIDRQATPQGNHIVLCVEVHQDYYVTIEGNAKGLNPDSKRVEGVVTNKRLFKDIAQIYRLNESDYI